MALLLSMLTLAASSYAQTFAQQCQNFQVNIPNVKVNVLEFVPNGTNITFPYTVC